MFGRRRWTSEGFRDRPTGRFEAYGHEITISALNIDVQSLVFFLADAAILKNVLGRRGWLDRVKVGLVDLTPSLSPASPPARTF